MPVPIPYVHMGIGFFSIAVSLPLIFRIVPMNHAYGVRVRKAFVSRSNWYKINSYGGKLFTVFGFFLLAFGWLGRDLTPPPTSLWAPVFMVVPLLLIIPLVVLINRFARRASPFPSTFNHG